MERKLYRNEHDKVIAGVASGLADYFQLDVTTVRLLLVLTTCFIPTSGAVVYVVLWLVAPVNNDPSKRFSKFNEYYGSQPFGADPMSHADSQFQNFTQQTNTGNWNSNPNPGSGFNTNYTSFDANDPYFLKQNRQSDQKSRIIIGSVLIAIGAFFLFQKLGLIPYWVSIFKLWPLLLVAGGIALIANRRRKQEWNEFMKANPNEGQTTGAPTSGANTEEPKKDENNTNL